MIDFFIEILKVGPIALFIVLFWWGATGKFGVTPERLHQLQYQLDHRHDETLLLRQKIDAQRADYERKLAEMQELFKDSKPPAKLKRGAQTVKFPPLSKEQIAALYENTARLEA
jgi:hypothetical protein